MPVLSELNRGNYLPLCRPRGEHANSIPLMTRTGSGRNLSIVTRKPYVSVPFLAESQSRQSKLGEVRLCQATQLEFRQVEPKGPSLLSLSAVPPALGPAPLRPPPGVDRDSRSAREDDAERDSIGDRSDRGGNCRCGPGASTEERTGIAKSAGSVFRSTGNTHGKFFACPFFPWHASSPVAAAGPRPFW